ncbi:MAG: HlyD family efflux transporter periplasmic adaptor subunit [Planctomycetaceae bacterium]|jgi:multidrug efflux pump subunit AcrA (membrane-fusion protein)|nr:HlyD family efflux transporter periplasmic adaptor subunit [Planctomycetaceae bacterium]
MSDVDLQQLVIERDQPDSTGSGGRRHLWTRYLLPGVLLVGFLTLIVWYGWDVMFPPRPVTVVPVLTTSRAPQGEGQVVFQASGWIEPRPTAVRVAALATGVIDKLLVVEDQLVERDEPVAELVRDDAELASRVAVADLALREAELADARGQQKAADLRFKRPVHLEAPLGLAEAELAKIVTQLRLLPFQRKRAEADLQFARKDHAGKVAAKGVVARVDVERSRAQLQRVEAKVSELTDQAKALRVEQAAGRRRCDALREQLKLLVDETEARERARARVKAGEARVERSRVGVAKAKLRLERMTVVAPMAGRVFRLISEPGARIGSGMTQMAGHDGSTVVTMYRPESLQVRVDVRFENLPEVRLQQPVRINNPALKVPIAGRVLFISSMADIQKNTLEVKVEIDAPAKVFRPEMLVDITFLSTGNDADGRSRNEVSRHYLPRSLIRQDAAGQFVWLADQANSTARRVSVSVEGAVAGGLVEIRGELAMGARVIAGGGEGVVDGERIRIVGEDHAATYMGEGPTSSGPAASDGSDGQGKGD